MITIIYTSLGNNPFDFRHFDSAGKWLSSWDRRMPVSVKENNGDLFSEDNGFLDEAFGNEREIVR